MRLKLFFILFFILSINNSLNAQVLDSTPVQLDTNLNIQKHIYLDSATIARNLYIKDSITHIQDSLYWQYLKTPDVNRPNLYINNLLKKFLITDKYLLTPAIVATKFVFKYGIGEVKIIYKYWILTLIISIVFYFGLVRYFFYQQLNNLFLAFYSEKYLKKINNNKGYFISFFFILLFLLFCLSFATYIYLVTQKIGNIYTIKDFHFIVILSASVLFFSLLNNFLIKLLGFVFNISEITNQYLALLYISMCNMLLILIPFMVIITMISSNYNKLIIWFSVVLLAIIYVLRFVRILHFIVSKHTFSKTYIFLYVCAFELCPLIILIRALNII